VQAAIAAGTITSCNQDEIMKTRLLITGGAGFIGSALVRHLLTTSDVVVVNVDKLTYSGNLEAVSAVQDSPNYHFEKVDICFRRDINFLYSAFCCLFDLTETGNLGENL